MRFPLLLGAALLTLAACGGQPDASTSPAGSSAASSSALGAPGAPASASGLTPAQLENGIGPISTVAVGDDVDAALAARGAELFNMKCSACHKMDERYVGPPLRDVTVRRKPAYVMNMMLNPAEMIQKHPEAKALLGQYMTQMPDQQLTQEDARALLEFLRQAAHEREEAGEAGEVEGDG